MLHDWPIKLRIVGASLGVILVMSSIAVIGLVTGRSVQANFDAYVSNAGISGFAADWRGDIAQLQLLGRTYLGAGLPKDLEATRGQMAAVERRVAAAPPYRSADEQRMIDEIVKSLADYRTEYEGAVKVAGELDVAKKMILTKIGIELRKFLSEANDLAIKDENYAASSRIGLLQESFLLARIRMQRFLDTGDKGDMEGARKVALEFEAMLSATIALTAGTTSVALSKGRELLPSYLGGFEEIVRLHAGVEQFRTQKLKAREDAILRLLEKLTTMTVDSMKTSEVAARAISQRSPVVVGTVSAIAIVISLLIAWLIGRGIANPVRRLNETMMKVVDGHTAVDIEGLTRRDEVGAMARAVAVFRDNAVEKQRLEAEKIKKQAADQRRREEIDQLVGIFGKSMSHLFQTVSTASAEMSATSSALEKTSLATTGQADRVMAEAEHSGASAQTVAAASVELSNSIEEIGRQVSQSTRIAGAAMQQIEQAAVTFTDLRAAASSIGTVVQLIQSIAGQTNLLALNATIEAARAGNAGKGFAVVAGEVKSLANQTSTATSDITAQIAAMQAATEGAVSAIDAIDGTIREINEITTGIASAVEEQGAATQEIARSIEQVSASTTNVTTSMIEVRRTTGEGSAKALEVKEKAGALSDEAITLSAEVRDLVEALGSLSDDKSFRTYTVDLPAVLKTGDRSVDVRVIKLSAGVVVFSGEIAAALGSKLAFTIAGVDRELSGRLVGREAGGIMLQLPLSHAHLTYMEEVIAKLVKEAA